MKKIRLRNITLVASIALCSTQLFAQVPSAQNTITPALMNGFLPNSNTFNPSMSINILGLYQNSSVDEKEHGFSLQEMELQFMADIDAYFKGNALITLGQENGKWAVSPEEVFVDTTSIPYVTFRLGKFKAALGKHNQLHTHAYPFIDAPLIHQTLLGEEGLNDAGISASALLSFMPWFSELTLQAFDSNNETLFNSSTHDDLAGVAHFKNLWDLSDATTAELGLSGAVGSNSKQGLTRVVGADLTVKYRPVAGGKYHSIQWATEYLYAFRSGFDSSVATSLGDLPKLDGLATWIQYQFAERWWISMRGEKEGLTQKDNLTSIQRGTVLLGFAPSEFSSFRIGYDLSKSADVKDKHHVALQANFTLGAHPAHSY